MIQRIDSFKEAMMLGKTEGRRRRQQRMRRLDDITDLMDMHRELVMDREACHVAVPGVAESDMTE